MILEFQILYLFFCIISIWVKSRHLCSIYHSYNSPKLKDYFLVIGTIRTMTMRFAMASMGNPWLIFCIGRRIRRFIHFVWSITGIIGEISGYDSIRLFLIYVWLFIRCPWSYIVLPEDVLNILWAFCRFNFISWSVVWRVCFGWLGWSLPKVSFWKSVHE